MLGKVVIEIFSRSEGHFGGVVAGSPRILLTRVPELLPLASDTAYIKTMLGEPIDMAHDYRYLLDSIGPDGCVIGVVFHISYTNGKIDNKWIGGICE